MMHDNLRCQAIAAAVQFAPVRRAADDMCGHADIHTAKIQANQFTRRWTSDEVVSYDDIRQEFVEEWSATVNHLLKWYDAVVAVQVELSLSYQWRSGRAPGDGFMRVRRAIPGLGTMVLQFATTETDQLTVHGTVLGHPGTPAVAELTNWLDLAQATIENAVLSLTAKEPSPWVREARS